MDYFVSIIVPTHNEESDISLTLEALVKQRYLHKEIIVVDDASQDGTVEIIQDYVQKYPFIKLIQQPVNQGAGVARNVGIRNSRGDILVILNADVFPPEDFLERILAHYAQGADYVLVGAQIANQEHLFPRYLEALSRFAYDGKDCIEWTEGFSCRKEAAIAVGLFPEVIPGCSGEDAIFGMNLSRKYRKVIDRSIVVPHIMPHTLRGFWLQQMARGRAVPYVHYYIYKRPLFLMALFFLGKPLYWSLRNLIEFPQFFVYYCYYSHQVHNRGWSDFFPFVYARLVEMFAQRVGEWKGWREIRIKR